MSFESLAALISSDVRDLNLYALQTIVEVTKHEGATALVKYGIDDTDLANTLATCSDEMLRRFAGSPLVLFPLLDFDDLLDTDAPKLALDPSLASLREVYLQSLRVAAFGEYPRIYAYVYGCTAHVLAKVRQRSVIDVKKLAKYRIRFGCRMRRPSVQRLRDTPGLPEARLLRAWLVLCAKSTAE